MVVISDSAFTEALRADTDGTLHAAMRDLAGQLMGWSCDRGGVQSEAFFRLALELRAILQAIPARPEPG